MASNKHKPRHDPSALKSSTVIPEMEVPPVRQAGEAMPVPANGGAHESPAPQANDEAVEPAPRQAEGEFIVASCGSCLFFASEDGENGQCRARPPSPLVVGITQHPITQQQMPVVNGFFPATNKNVWCGAWARKPSLEQRH